MHVFIPSSAHPSVNEVMLSVNFCSDNLGSIIQSINESHCQHYDLEPQKQTDIQPH